MAHVHSDMCIVEDTMDYGDDGDGAGYQAHQIFTCTLTGESHKNFNDFFEE